MDVVEVGEAGTAYAADPERSARAAGIAVRLARLRHTPATTLDGQKIELLANIEMPEDTMAAIKSGAVGVGLFRSEFLFMGRQGQLPDEQEQYEAYVAAIDGMQGLPVTIRLLDPPLHEFLPHTQSEIEEVARAMNTDPRRIADRKRVWDAVARWFATREVDAVPMDLSMVRIRSCTNSALVDRGALARLAMRPERVA